MSNVFLFKSMIMLYIYQILSDIYPICFIVLVSFLMDLSFRYLHFFHQMDFESSISGRRSMKLLNYLAYVSFSHRDCKTIKYEF